MAKFKTFHPVDQSWIDARWRHNLTHSQVQMARELGMNPQRLERIDDHHDKEWKIPLPEYIQKQYENRFGADQRVSDLSVEERVRQTEAKKSAKRQKKRLKRVAEKTANPKAKSSR